MFNRCHTLIFLLQFLISISFLLLILIFAQLPRTNGRSNGRFLMAYHLRLSISFFKMSTIYCRELFKSRRFFTLEFLVSRRYQVQWLENFLSRRSCDENLNILKADKQVVIREINYLLLSRAWCAFCLSLNKFQSVFWIWNFFWPKICKYNKEKSFTGRSLGERLRSLWSLWSFGEFSKTTQKTIGLIDRMIWATLSIFHVPNISSFVPNRIFISDIFHQFFIHECCP